MSTLASTPDSPRSTLDQPPHAVAAVGARRLRGVAFVVSLALIAAAQLAFSSSAYEGRGWQIALAALIVAAAWQYATPPADWRQGDGRAWGLAPQRWRWVVGIAVVGIGGWLWFDASRQLSADWAVQDRSFLTWVAAAIAISIGFGIMQAPRTAARNRLGRWEWTLLLLLFVVAGLFRLVNYQNYPPPEGVSQVEELQAGQFGTQYLSGYRGRWEFLSQAWIEAVGISWLGNTLLAVRLPYSIISWLKVLPAYFWFRALGGPVAAATGTALLALSGWDSIIGRIPGHPDALIAICCLGLLAGPAVRGAWAAYPWIGLMAGFSTLSYIAFRPLAALAVMGVMIASFAQTGVRRTTRGLRVVAATILVIAMAAALFVPLAHRLANGFSFEYLNGWNRARGNEEYYAHDDTWTVMLGKRWERATMAAALFYTHGDINATHNVGGRPQIDPVTGSLLLLGLGCTTVMWWRGFYGLVLVAFAITFYGTLIATGNFDILRAQATIPYVYALVAIGAGSLYAGADRYFGRIGRRAIAVLLTAGVLWAALWNGKLLHDLWTSSYTRQHYRSDLPYLSIWLRDHAAGKRVIGLIPSNSNVVFLENDAAWLRGREVRGESTWDIGQTLQKLATAREDVTLLVAAPVTSRDLAEYFEYRLPGLRMEIRLDDVSGAPRMAFGTLPLNSPALQAAQRSEADCRGARAQFVLVRQDRSAIATVREIVPVIDAGTWPGAMRSGVMQHERDAWKVEASWQADFVITEAGDYVIVPQSYEGGVEVTIDNVRASTGGAVPMSLSAGPHHLEMHGEFNARILEPMARLSWSRVGAHDEPQLIPFYRLAVPDPECMARLTPGTQPAG